MARRVFFALWPSPALADEITPRAARLGRAGRLVPPDRLHLTLAFYADLADHELPDLIERAEALRPEAFTLVIDRVRSWNDVRAVVFAPSAVPGRLQSLAGDLTARGVDPTAFKPHITVIREGLPGTDESLFPSLIWHVDRFALIESGSQGHPGGYQVLARWPLIGRSHSF